MAVRPAHRLLLAVGILAFGLAGASEEPSAPAAWVRTLSDLHSRAETAADPALTRALALEPQLGVADSPARLPFYRELCHVASLAHDETQAERAATQLAGTGHGRSAAAASADAATCRAELQFEGGQRLLALRAVQRALDWVRDESDPASRYYTAFMLGYIADRNNEFAIATEGFEIAAAAAEATGNLADQVRLDAERARLYHQLDQSQRAAETADRAIARARELGDPELSSLAWATKYYCLPDDDSPASFEALQQARDYARRSGNASRELVMQANLSDYLLQSKQYRAAIAAAIEALHMAARTTKSIHNDSAYAIALANLGFARIRLHDSSGRQDVEQALSLLSEADKPVASAVSLDYADTLAATGDYRRAWSAMQAYKKISDEVSSSDRQNRVLQLQEMFAAERLERQNAQLRDDNQLKNAALERRALEQRIAWLASALAVLGLASIALAYRRAEISYRALRARHRELDFNSRRDPLTGLLNRSAFAERIEALLTRASANAQEARHQALVLADIDRFKDINDTYGHAAGDAVLRTVAVRLREALRDTDVIARWGGEEFLVLLPAVPDGTLEAVVARVLSSVAVVPVALGNRDLVVTVSAGFARLPVTVSTRPLNWQRLVNLVDLLLYKSKAAGRNRATGLSHSLSFDSEEELASFESGASQARELPLVTIAGPAQPRLRAVS
ncbi:MAG TPA: diguanylate cyclase [Steroidobacteraceae bacterium]|nr:diguanylate cyclase [Steroidobacteraceae bacterium]